MRVTLLELAERVEKTTGPDRELEIAIWRALNPIHAKIADDMGRVPLEWLHNYTESLDAAMALVPEGYNVTLERSDDTWGAVVWHPLDSRQDMAELFISAPLALTAACLRARHDSR